MALCAVCQEDHIDDEVRDRAVRIGLSLVHPDCSWALRYPGMSANDVIVDLERKLAQRAGPAATDAPTDEASTDDAVSVADDPAERADENSFVEEKLCPVCQGDGEVVDPEDPHNANLCGRCNGEGRIKVTG